MNKKILILFDALIIILAIIGISISTTMPNMMSIIRQEKALEGSEDLGFNIIPSPSEAKVKAGETVTIKMNVADINVGENGLNSIVGFLDYNEPLFESMKIEASENWKVELNQRTNHPLYGKFCIYTMQEGVKEEQQVITITLKLKSDIAPQVTEVKFSGLVSSDGNVEISDIDRTVKIIIYDDEVPVIPDEPDIPVEPTKPDIPKTGDQVVVISLITIGIVAIINIIVLMKSKKNKIIASAITAIVFILLITTAVLAVTPENLNTFSNLSEKESWLNSSKCLVKDGSITRIAPKTTLEKFKNELNKSNITVYDNQQAEENN